MNLIPKRFSEYVKIELRVPTQYWVMRMTKINQIPKQLIKYHAKIKSRVTPHYWIEFFMRMTKINQMSKHFDEYYIKIELREPSTFNRILNKNDKDKSNSKTFAEYDVKIESRVPPQRWIEFFMRMTKINQILKRFAEYCVQKIESRVPA